MGRGGQRYGAGRPGWRRKCEQSLAFDVRSLHRKRLLSPGQRYSWTWTTNYGEKAGNVSVSVQPGRVTLDYQWTPYGGDPVPVSCVLFLDHTPCNYGGNRPWFLCPQCWQRCAVVYWGAPGGRYACRKCLRLAYLSEAEDLSSRLWRKQAKLENRLGEDWTRPKGMHRRTWERITERIIAIESRKDDLLFGAMARLGMLDDLPGIFN